MKKIFYTSILMIGLYLKSYGQFDDIPIEKLDGIYLSTNDNKNYHLLNHGRYLFFFLNEQNDVIRSLIRVGSFGFYLKDANLDSLLKVDLHALGNDDSKLVFRAENGTATSYEFETGGRSLNLYNQNAFFYQKLYVLPNAVIQQLRLIAKQKHIDIEKFLFSIETIGVNKAMIYSTPHAKTNMYLLKGDKIKVIQEDNDWLKFEYKGKKMISGWVKKSDLAHL